MGPSGGSAEQGWAHVSREQTWTGLCHVPTSPSLLGRLDQACVGGDQVLERSRSMQSL